MSHSPFARPHGSGSVPTLSVKGFLGLASLLLVACQILCANAATSTDLDKGWQEPPLDARLRAYWWWLNSNVTKEAITRDLEEMRQKGFGGALICDAGGAEQDGNDRVPHGPTFMSPEWRELYKHTLREADRLGLEMSLNILSGWNLGGPSVTADDAAKKLTWSEQMVHGPGTIKVRLPQPRTRDDYYRDLFVVGFPIRTTTTTNLAGGFTGLTASSARIAEARLSGPDGAWPERATQQERIKNWEQKAMHRALHSSAPNTAPLFEELPESAAGMAIRSSDVRDLSAHLSPDGELEWDVPAGEWQIIRFGCTIGDHSRVSTSSEGWSGYALDVLDAGSFTRYWDAVVEPLISDAGPLAGKTLKYLHTDSWEVEAINWTPSLSKEFRSRRGYDFLKFAPALTGRVVDSRPISNRFLHDYRKTLGDLAIDNHYRIFRERAHARGLLYHPESGGPHAVPIDAQRCLGWNDAPMSEFWAWSWRHRVGDENRFFVKQPASAAHVYGRKLVLAEGFTTIGPHWQETIWDNLKPSFDKAICEGLNLLVWHAFVCSPQEMGMPGQQYFAGTHFNPNTTWWSRSGPFLAYINRSQHLMQQGLPVCDVAYYYGDHVPNFSQLKRSDPAGVLPGFDYDTITEEAILTRLEFKDGRFVLPDGMSYRVLVLPKRTIISLPVLRKLRGLVASGGTIVGPKPVEAASLKDYPQCDQEVRKLADEVWGTPGTDEKMRRFERGRVVWGMTAGEVLTQDSVAPDFSFSGDPGASIDFFHRKTPEADIYFVANRSNRWETIDASFRVEKRLPELWNLVTGERRMAAEFRSEAGTIKVPLQFSPCGSWAIIFREPSQETAQIASGKNWSEYRAILELSGKWDLTFDPKWGGPGPVVFPELTSWTKHSEPGIKFYSGTAVYRKNFDLPRTFQEGARVWLDLGNLRELGEVRINGKPMGVVWAPPFRVEITGAVKASNNQLEVDVVNFWPNRLIGDEGLPSEKRLTRTNIRKLTQSTPLMESGLFGPVQLLIEK